MVRRGQTRPRAAKLALAVCKVWKDLGVPHAKMRSVNDKIFKLLNVRRDKRRSGVPLIPDGERLVDIAACKCFLFISPDLISLDRCRCKESPWNQVSFQFYVDQRGQRKLRAWFVDKTHDTRSEDAVAAEAEDTAIERAREEEDDDGARRADIQMEEEEFAKHDHYTAHIAIEDISADDYYPAEDVNMDSGRQEDTDGR